MSLSFKNHGLEACFKPYNDFRSLPTALGGRVSSSFGVYPGGEVMYISSSKSPFKKALELSN